MASCFLHKKIYEANLCSIDESGYPKAFDLGVLHLHFDGPALDTFYAAARAIEFAIENAESDPW
jgi:hypothetical protein